MFAALCRYFALDTSAIMPTLLDIPPEIWSQIIQPLDVASLACIRATCQRTRAVVDDVFPTIRHFKGKPAEQAFLSAIAADVRWDKRIQELWKQVETALKALPWDAYEYSVRHDVPVLFDKYLDLNRRRVPWATLRECIKHRRTEFAKRLVDEFSILMDWETFPLTLLQRHTLAENYSILQVKFVLEADQHDAEELAFAVEVLMSLRKRHLPESCIHIF